MCNSIPQNVGHFVTQKKKKRFNFEELGGLRHCKQKTVASRIRVGVKKGVARNRTTKN